MEKVQVSLGDVALVKRDKKVAFNGQSYCIDGIDSDDAGSFRRRVGRLRYIKGRGENPHRGKG